jgi:hypothetical protein
MGSSTILNSKGCSSVTNSALKKMEDSLLFCLSQKQKQFDGLCMFDWNAKSSVDPFYNTQTLFGNSYCGVLRDVA